MVGVLTSWIFKNLNFQQLLLARGAICIIVSNLSKIGQTVVEIWPLDSFQNGDCLPSWISKI